MKFVQRYKKIAAAFMLIVFASQVLLPTYAFALTSGPEQPEMKGFESIGNSDMVDLFSGDFSYNIPLMDVGGYPVNLAYHSGSSMDDEASWVGYGWGLNVGSLNRNLRGIPDDFNGTDKMERVMSMKDHVTYGGRFSMALDLLGVPVKKINKKLKKKKLDLSLTLSAGIKYDNYRGIGADIGANAGASLSSLVAGKQTAGTGEEIPDTTKAGTLSGSFGLNMNSQEGASLSLNSSILANKAVNEDKLEGVSSSIGFGYNTRAGLTGMTLGGSFSVSERDKKEKLRTSFSSDFIQSSISFNGSTFSPTIDHPTKSNSYTFTVHLGLELQVALTAVGVTGFYSKQAVAENTRRLSAYGYLQLEKANGNENALTDFNREKDIPYSKQVKYLPIVIPTYDLFSATSQDGGGQYRLYRGSSGVFSDHRTETINNDLTLGIELGGGTYFDVGADLYNQDIKTITKKWTERNDYLSKGDFRGASASSPLYEPAYFKRVGEPVPYDKSFVDKIKSTSPVAVSLRKNLLDGIEGAFANEKLRTKYNNAESIPVLKRDKREVRNTTFSYLTAKEAKNHALEKTIKDYDPDSLVVSGCTGGGIRSNISRVGSYRKAHHFSEITITGDDGKRNIYGIPVYNKVQQEVTFSVGGNLALRKKGLINYTSEDNSVSNKKGRENYYSKESTPPYATSYLLTAILSPDYIDRKNDGITDDDQGTAVKFNYSQLTSSYKWRSPFANGADTANYNEGFLSDAQDDKANYAYGEREVWYLHSIESKTMVAQFVTEDRLDGLGVINSDGAVDASLKLKRLKEIRLYSKSDLILNGNDLTKVSPIKVVHFVYDYSICQGLPNSVDHVGKLTLKRIYFTFGSNQKGKLNPYDFQYDTSYNFYDYRQYDRWGNFKDAANNPNGLSNSEFPYTLQDTISNHFASAWQLNKIILPSGGTINVQYESDDYAYVQDKRASQMCMINGVGSSNSSSGLIGADYLYVNLPYPVSTQNEMIERYFEGVSNLYYKCLIDLDGKGHKEFVPGYAELDGKPQLQGTNIAKIKLKKIKGTNPIAKAGWQFIRTNLPKYAYPGSDNLESNHSNLRKSIEALVTAFGTVKELLQGFEKRAKNKGYSNTVVLDQSWVRLCSPQWKKYGGGSRVKRIDISDDWATMSGATGAKTSTYSQVYDYSTKDARGRTISSGVASYEPLLGNDENPFRQPVRYTQKDFLALNNYYYIEEPFGESFFPGASVGYSKVTVRTVGSGDDETVNRTGSVVSEFYTAKDYPTKIDMLGIEQAITASDKIFKLIGGITSEMVGLSQGYSVETNDMHGKPKSVQVFNKSGQKISSVEYFYKSVNELAARRELRNDVKVINADGSVVDGTIGMDVEMFSDMRQQTTNNLGESVKLSGGSGAILIFPLPFFFPGLGINNDRKNFRSASTIKIINRFAIQYKVVKMENGSTITSENLLWDAETGNVLLSKSQNEFDDPVYSFAYPAHWVYDGMGQAYKNLGTVLYLFSTGSNGTISNGTYNSLLTPGDELIDIQTAAKYWVINSPISAVYAKRIVDENGALQTLSNKSVKLLRSGRRNMANTAVATIACLENPIVGNKLDVSQLSQILDAKATVFNEEWSVPVKTSCAEPGVCEEGCTLSTDSTYCYKINYGDTVNAVESNTAGMFCTSSDPNYSNFSTYIYDTTTLTDSTAITFSNTFWRNSTFSFVDGPLNRSAVWPCSDPGYDRPPLNTWVSLTVHIYAPSTKIYYIGVGGDNDLKFSVNNVLKLTTTNGEAYKNWRILPVLLNSGLNALKLEVRNTGGPGAIAAEVYDNSAAEITSATSYSDLHVLFSTRDILDVNFELGTLYSPACPSGYTPDSTGGVIRCREYVVCHSIDPEVGNIMNPYKLGILGNWRGQSQYVYQTSRENLVSDPAKAGSTNIRKSGAYSVFSPFWAYTGSSWTSSSDPAWIAANKVTNFNNKGIEVENKDALNRYSSALFGYLESIPIAVASNTRYRELGYDGFEDYNFNVDCGTDTCPNNRGHFNFKKYLNGSTVTLSQATAHSGKFSLALNGTVSMTKTIYTGDPDSIYGFDNVGRYILKANELSKGFSPIPGKKYVLSFWVKDGSPRDATTTVQASINGSNLLSSSTTWPVVEGWKRIETQFVLPSIASSFVLQLHSGSAVYIDDIRIHPFDGQMKSFAYDPSSQRLWAEMDENNFATFYEYDDEGILIRVKKETERGIMTIKETRSSYRKRQ